MEETLLSIGGFALLIGYIVFVCKGIKKEFGKEEKKKDSKWIKLLAYVSIGLKFLRVFAFIIGFFIALFFIIRAIIRFIVF